MSPKQPKSRSVVELRSSSVWTAGSTKSTGPPLTQRSCRPYATSSRRAQSKSTRATGPRSSSGDNPETAKIRVWTNKNGHQVSDRGRIHQSVKDAYYAAQ